MAHPTNLRCQRQRVRRWSSERERQPARERQRVERQLSAPHHRSETIKFLLYSCGGVFFSSPFFHPPSILPISSNFSESREYFSLGKHLFSQAICRKNLTPSSLEIAMIRRGILVSGGR